MVSGRRVARLRAQVGARDDERRGRLGPRALSASLRHRLRRRRVGRLAFTLLSTHTRHVRPRPSGGPFHAQLRRHRPARPAVPAPDRADEARRGAGLRVRLDLRLARALAGVDAGDGAPRRPDLEDQARPHGHQPRHPRPDGARERLRDAPGHLERPHDHGSRPGRLVGALRGPQADEGRRLRGSAEDGQAVHERQGGHLERQAAAAEMGAAGAAGDRDARRRLRAEGARGRGAARATA